MKLVVANWKLYLTIRESVVLAKHVVRSVSRPRARVVLCPTAPALATVGRELQETPYLLGAQDVAIARYGPYTGELSPLDLRNLGCRYVIVGHSERRRLLSESDAIVRQKLESALATGLRPILCVGETSAERREGETHAVIRRQLQSALRQLHPTPYTLHPIIIAYEPVWATSAGPGRPSPQPTPQEVVAMHQFIRKTAKSLLGRSAKLKILYGGSVDTKTFAQIISLPGVDGVLVGGASTKPSFIEMLKTVH